MPSEAMAVASGAEEAGETEGASRVALVEDSPEGPTAV